MTEPARKPDHARDDRMVFRRPQARQRALRHLLQGASYHERNACWDDIQRAYATAAAARAAYPAGRRCRVMEVTPQGRQPIA